MSWVDRGYAGQTGALLVILVPYNFPPPPLQHCVLQPGHPSSCPTDRVVAIECEGDRATGWGDATLGGGSHGAGITPVFLQSPSSCGWWVALGSALGGWK